MRASTLNRAFTLIELLVVIAIIAILAAILFPVFARARDRAAATTCLSNEKQLAAAFMMYAQDYDGRLPRWWTDKGGPDGKARDWATDTWSYVKSQGVYKCPARPRSNRGVGFNAWLAWGDGCGLFKLKQPTQTCLFTEMEDPAHKGDPRYDVDRSTPYNWPVDRRFWFAKTRHGDGANMGFADGHAKFVKYDDKTVGWSSAFSGYSADTPISAALGGTPRGTYFWPTPTAP
jgi:prepilin-type N-terminal cleavage/methylation domain-containing protein/prepilin-type processing-associated H-X9-DG protein